MTGRFQVLIDTQWNVNYDYFTLATADEKVLIDTQWNVNKQAEWQH